MSDSESRRRWVTFGEIIGLAALVISGLGLWITWKNNQEDKPTKVVEQKQSVPLVLRGIPDRDGSSLTIAPVDPGHALESLTLTIKGASPIDAGSDGKIGASDVAAALKDRAKETKDRAYSVPVRIDARYVEMGADRRGGRNYVLRYRWEGGGLFGGRSLHLLGLGR